MKLLHKTALYSLLVSLPIVLGGAFLLNHYVHRNVIHELDELLLSKLIQIQKRLRERPPGLRELSDWDPDVQIAPIPNTGPLPVSLSDSTRVDPRENETVPVRRLRTSYAINGRVYRITIQQSYLELNEVADNLAVGVTLCFLVIVLLLLFTELLISRRIWQPFYGVIRQLQRYRIDGSDITTMPASNVYEFRLLEQTLTGMIQRSRQQYIQQKQFTDNASHEMQTPLSVVSFELDLLQQSERLGETDLEQIQRVQQEVRRLSAINQSLLLLARIDNKQFSQSEPIPLGQLLEKILDTYADYAAHKRIVVSRIISANPVRLLNRQLAEVLFSNLVKNALRHGDAGGTLLVEVMENDIRINNEGDPLPFPEENLFQRFVRNQEIPQSTGLGLALVKEIAEQYGMQILYQYVPLSRQHQFQIHL